MEIQTRTRGFAGNRVSVVSAVAANVAGDVIEFALGSPPLLNGEPVEIGVDTPLDLGNGAAVFRSSRHYVVVWPGSENRPVMRVRVAGSFINVGVQIPEAMAGQVSGLLGDNDGDR